MITVIRTLTSDLQDLAQGCARLCKSSASPLATYVMISWQVRAFLQPSCPTTTWATTIFDMHDSTINMQVKQQKLTQGDMSSVSHKNMVWRGKVVQGENVGSFVSKF
jgi:hypothetical protein